MKESIKKSLDQIRGAESYFGHSVVYSTALVTLSNGILFDLIKHVQYTKKSQKNGQNLRKTVEKQAILPKCPFKRATSVHGQFIYSSISDSNHLAV